MSRVFERLIAMYGVRFTDMWRGVDLSAVKDVWGESLSGYTGKEIAHGLIGCLSKPYPPTLPEFLLLCRPVVSDEELFIHAVTESQKRRSGGDRWKSAQVYWAYVIIGGDIHRHPYQSLKSRWSAAMKEAKEKIEQGEYPESVPAALIALPRQSELLTEKSVCLANLAAMKEALVLRTVSTRHERESCHNLMSR